MVRKIAWLSFDDTFGGFFWLYKNPTATSIWQSPTFAWMKAQHDAYGAVFICPTFLSDLRKIYSAPDRSLGNVVTNSTWQAEFAAASSWLKFSFHSQDYILTYFETGALYNGSRKPETFDLPTYLAADYAALRAQVIRICGAASWDDSYMQLHYRGSNAAQVATIRAAHPGAFNITTNWNRNALGNVNYCEYFLNESGADAGFFAEMNATTHRLMSDGTLMLKQTVCPEANCIDYPGSAGNTTHTVAEYMAALPPQDIEYVHFVSHEKHLTAQYATNYPICKTWAEDFIAWASANGYEWKHPEVGDFDTPTTLTATAAGDHIALRFPPTVGTQYVERRVI